jgi:hypothetical protein
MLRVVQRAPKSGWKPRHDLDFAPRGVRPLTVSVFLGADAHVSLVLNLRRCRPLNPDCVVARTDADTSESETATATSRALCWAWTENLSMESAGQPAWRRE